MHERRIGGKFPRLPVFLALIGVSVLAWMAILRLFGAEIG
jgi:hypothetical protein